MDYGHNLSSKKFKRACQTKVTYPLCPHLLYTKIPFFILNKNSIVVVIGAVDKWIDPQNGERFLYEIHDNEPIERLEAMGISYPHRR